MVENILTVNDQQHYCYIILLKNSVGFFLKRVYSNVKKSQNPKFIMENTEEKLVRLNNQTSRLYWGKKKRAESTRALNS